MSMFHTPSLRLWRAGVKQFKLHQILFFFFLITLPLQTRIIFDPVNAYIGGVFNYHLAFILYLSDLAFILAIFDWLLFDFSFRETTFRETLLKIGLFFGLILITLFHVKHLDLGLYSSLKWAEMLILLVYCTFAFKDRKMFHVTLYTLLFSGVIQALIGIWQFHVQHGLNLGFLGEYLAPLGTSGLSTLAVSGIKLVRAYGTMPHPNVLGGFLIVSLIAGLYLLSRETMFHRKHSDHPRESGDPPNGSRIKSGVGLAFVSCATFLILLGIFFTFSRIAWISAVLAFISFLLFHVKHRNWFQMKLTALVVIVSCATILIGYQDLLVSRATESLDSNSINLRETYNQQGIELIKKYPVLGVGVGHYIPALRDLYQLEDWQYQPAHNIYIFLGVELGLLGLGLFLLIVGQIISQVWAKKNDPLTFALLVAVGIFLFIGLFDHYPLTIQQTRLTFFLLLGLLLASTNLQETKTE